MPEGSTLLRFDNSLLVEGAAPADPHRHTGSSLSEALEVADHVRLNLAARRALGCQHVLLDCIGTDRSRRLVVRLGPDPERSAGGLAVAVDIGPPQSRGNPSGAGPPALEHDQLLAVAAGRELARSTYADEARTTICEALRQLAGADHAVLFEPDRSRRELRVTSADGVEIPLDASLPAADASGPGRALSTGSAQFVADPTTEPTAARDLMRALGARSALWQPIRRGRSLRGILMLAYESKVEPPAKRTARLLESVAAEAAVAIDRGVAFGRLASLAATDGLTELPNRRAWEDGLAREMARAAREGTPLSVAMLDLDNFKALNDREGHAVGDRTLRSIADLWRPMLRAADLLGRYGGDEFGLILPRCGPEAASRLIERLRIPEIATDFSCGLVLWDGGEERDQLVARADQALYRAKAKGASLFDGG